MPFHALPTRRQAYATCAVAGLTVVVCTAILSLALLAAAPAAVLPLVAAVCIGCPLALGWSLPASIAVLQATGRRPRRRELRSLRRHLDRLPEIKHPLDL